MGKLYQHKWRAEKSKKIYKISFSLLLMLIGTNLLVDLVLIYL